MFDPPLRWLTRHEEDGVHYFLGGTIHQDPSVSKPNRLHVVIVRFFYINLRYILYIPLKQHVIFLETLTFIRSFG